MQSCVHSFSFFLPDRPTHVHEREGDGKRNILWGWPKKVYSRQSIVFQREEASLRRLNLIFGMRLIATMGSPAFQNALTKISPTSGVRHIRNELQLVT